MNKQENTGFGHRIQSLSIWMHPLEDAGLAVAALRWPKRARLYQQPPAVSRVYRVTGQRLGKSQLSRTHKEELGALRLRFTKGEPSVITRARSARGWNRAGIHCLQLKA
ncbi:hypothetical protein PG993_009795 [Apiospora rasikravindrae]|uniref:Uncharacterized protein n=1 Tax=Apiospora rasikravindrae TaxID=990691 RepID=A0ABR1SKD5_9PEZI